MGSTALVGAPAAQTRMRLAVTGEDVETLRTAPAVDHRRAARHADLERGMRETRAERMPASGVTLPGDAAAGEGVELGRVAPHGGHGSDSSALQSSGQPSRCPWR